MKDCRGCLAFEEKENKDGHFEPYCDLYGMYLKSLKCPCEVVDSSTEEQNDTI